MAKRRIWRFVVEALFLALVAALVTVADLRAAAVIVVMALAWVVVALFEWAAWVDEPHYGRGLPPRFYVPQVALPPPRTVEQPRSRYPGRPAREDEPTVVASPAEWAAAAGAWPLLDSAAAGEETEIAIHDEPLPEFPPDIEHPAAGPSEAPAGQAVVDEPEPAAAPAARRETRAPLTDAVEAEAFELPEPVRAGVARHQPDPLTSGGRHRLWLRPAQEDTRTIEVPDRPSTDRALPSNAPGARGTGNR